MEKIIWQFIIMSLFFIPSMAFALKCTPIVPERDNRNIVIPGVTEPKSSKIIILQNISKESIWLDHPQAKRSVSAGWSSYIRPGHWSALMLNRKTFALSCAAILPGKVVYKNCIKSIAVCVPQQNKTAVKRKGTTHWLVEDVSFDELAAALKKKGF